MGRGSSKISGGAGGGGSAVQQTVRSGGSPEGVMKVSELSSEQRNLLFGYE